MPLLKALLVFRNSYIYSSFATECQPYSQSEKLKLMGFSVYITEIQRLKSEGNGEVVGVCVCLFFLFFLKRLDCIQVCGKTAFLLPSSMTSMPITGLKHTMGDHILGATRRMQFLVFCCLQYQHNVRLNY